MHVTQNQIVELTASRGHSRRPYRGGAGKKGETGPVEKKGELQKKGHATHLPRPSSKARLAKLWPPLALCRLLAVPAAHPLLDLPLP